MLLFKSHLSNLKGRRAQECMYFNNGHTCNWQLQVLLKINVNGKRKITDKWQSILLSIEVSGYWFYIQRRKLCCSFPLTTIMSWHLLSCHRDMTIEHQHLQPKPMVNIFLNCRYSSNKMRWRWSWIRNSSKEMRCQCVQSTFSRQSCQTQPSHIQPLSCTWWKPRQWHIQ